MIESFTFYLTTLLSSVETDFLSLHPQKFTIFLENFFFLLNCLDIFRLIYTLYIEYRKLETKVTVRDIQSTDRVLQTIQMKLIFYGSGQSRPFWAELKLL